MADTKGHANLVPRHALKEAVLLWLKEDCPNFDMASSVLGEKEETAILLCKSPGILAGCPFIDVLFQELNCSVEWLVEEGEFLLPICEVARVKGMTRDILLGERVALNCLARISGVASACRRCKEICDRSGWHGTFAGTRKTTPGFRLAEKYGLLVGGAATHRQDLSSMVMLKDNHIWSSGCIENSVKLARAAAGFSTKIEVECRSVAEALSAFDAGADIVMLDNFNPKALHEAAEKIKAAHPGKVVEASGGITEDNLAEYTGPHIDVISMSALTQGYRTIDFSLKILKDGRNPSNLLVK